MVAWLLTPARSINNLKDLYSLGKFLGLSGGLEKCTMFLDEMKDHQKLQTLVGTLCLRRTKKMAFVNLKLPEKLEEVIRIEFTKKEDAMYQKLL